MFATEMAKAADMAQVTRWISAPRHTILMVMSQQITITVSDEVYLGLQRTAGNRSISEVIEELARPIVAEAALEESYRELSLDADRELEAVEWIEALVGDSAPGGEIAPR
jgi:predicted CopG family antitoxin